MSFLCDSLVLAMGKLPPGAHNRLLNLLYKKTVPEINTKLPIVKRVLYDSDPDEASLKSVLDELTERLWRQKPIETATLDVKNTLPNATLSNVLHFPCKNSLVGRLDFHNIFPVNRERHYFLDQELRKGLNFHTVKGRNPVSLKFSGLYYLVFPNVNQACVYYSETKGKVINGFKLNFAFVLPTEQHLKRMSSPLFQAYGNAIVENSSKAVDPTSVGIMAIRDIFRHSLSKLRIIDELELLDADRTQYTHTTKDPLFDLLALYMDVPSRYKQVVVRNYPFGLSKPALLNLLWDYQLASTDNPLNSIAHIHSDPVTQTTSTLLNFKDEANARRFVRNHHGRKWEKILNRKDKALYEPILCEILD